jgi:hypothetical protein
MLDQHALLHPLDIELDDPLRHWRKRQNRDGIWTTSFITLLVHVAICHDAGTTAAHSLKNQTSEWTGEVTGSLVQPVAQLVQ